MKTIFSGSVSALLLLLMCRAHATDAIETYFDPLSPSHTRGVIGHRVELPCTPKVFHQHSIGWSKVIGRNTVHIASGFDIIPEDDRMKTLYNSGGAKTYYLIIEDGVKEDEGTYYCNVNKSPLGVKAITLTMIEDLPTRRWRTDSQCGQNDFAEGDLLNAKTECDAEGAYPCCSWSGWCGFTANHCNCSHCVDYRNIQTYNEPSNTQSTTINEACSWPYEKVLDRCLLYSNMAMSWSEGEDFCQNYGGGHLITFNSLDKLVELATHLTTNNVVAGGNVWVGLSTEGSRQGESTLQWRWTTGDHLPHDSPLLKASDNSNPQCGFLEPEGLQAIIITTKNCSHSKLPLCEQNY